MIVFEFRYRGTIVLYYWTHHQQYLWWSAGHPPMEMFWMMLTSAMQEFEDLWGPL